MIALAALLCLAPSWMVTIPAGTYQIGKADHVDNPIRKVKVAGFEIARTETTNADWVKFISATGYVTDAEKRHNAMVFEPGLPEFRWIQDRTATWRWPNGKTRGDLTGKANHPVTAISFYDALQYCKWAHVRLPTLEEWEVACRAGTKTDYFFGSSPTKIGEYANVWHGKDHLKPDVSDGYMYTSPVGSFKPNSLGLYDMYGNVFEFCSGRVFSDHRPDEVHSRGGSWWCSSHACCFFNSADIGRVNIHASFSNQGFRVARSVGGVKK